MKSLRDVVETIEAGSVEIRASAAEVTARIKLFEAWMNRLPGKVPVSCEWATDAEGETSHNLQFAKEGKEWALYTYTHDARFDHYSESTLLRDAPITTKIGAMAAFPKLLEALATRQREVAKHAGKAAQEFDALARDLKIGEGR